MTPFLIFYGAFIDFCRQIHTDEKVVLKLEAGAKKWRNWSGYQYFGIGDEEFLRLLNRFYAAGGCRLLRPYKKHIAHYLNKLIDAGWEIVFVTKRASYTIMQSVHSLIDLGVVFDRLYSIDKIEGSVIYDYLKDEVNDINVQSKYDVFMIEKPQVVIDDASHYIEEAIQARCTFARYD